MMSRYGGNGKSTRVDDDHGLLAQKLSSIFNNFDFCPARNVEASRTREGATHSKSRRARHPSTMIIELINGLTASKVRP